jgi:TRAP-type C4-dicarboxylate transport system substrate-binding protein
MRNAVSASLGGAAATVLFCSLGAPAQAQGVTTLRIADSLPSGSFIYQLVTKPFMDEVEKATEGKVKFQYFPGQQLGKAKDMLKLTQTGMADIGYVGPSYILDKMPLSAVFELPGAFSDDSCQGFKAFWNMTHDGGFLEKNEFAPNQIIPVLSIITRHHVYVSNDRSVKSVKDLADLKMRSTGGAMAYTVSELGMVPVSVSAPETYESMSRGTIDGAIFPAQSAFDYGLTPLIKSATIKKHFAGVVLTYAISETTWKKLPKKTQDIILDVGKRISTTACTQFDAAEQAAISKMRAQGVKEITFDAAGDKVVDAAFERSSQRWAKSLDERGKPGSATLAAMRKAVAEVK